MGLHSSQIRLGGDPRADNGVCGSVTGHRHLAQEAAHLLQINRPILVSRARSAATSCGLH
jgi:hypothetical protein